MRCVIVGAAGFVGRQLGSRLQALGHEVTGLDAIPATDADFPIHGTDILHAEVPSMDGIDAVYYLPQYPRYRAFPEGAGMTFAVHSLGPVRVLESAQRAGVRFFCYASTGNVYAPTFSPLREDSPLRRDEAYALSKLAGEEAVTLFSPWLKVISARLFGVYGPGQKKGLVRTISDRVHQGAPVTVEPHPSNPGDRDGLKVSLCYVGDVANILGALPERAVHGGELPSVLNIGGPEPVSVRTLAERIARVSGQSATFEIAERPRTCDLVADISRLRILLAPTFTPFDQALDALIASR